MWPRFLIVLLLACWPVWGRAVAAPAQAEQVRDTMLLKDADAPHVSEAGRYYTEPFATAPDPERVEAEWRAGRFRTIPWHKTLNLGLRHERVWLRLTVRNTEPERLRFLWSIFNFTDSTALYCRRQGETRFTRLGMSTSWVPAAGRPFPARSLSFPFTLQAHETAVLYLRIDLYAGALYLPTYIETTEHFLAWEMNFPFERHWVLLVGFYVSCALFNLVLYAFLRDRIHLWYIAYVVCVTLFLMMEDGLDAMLLPTAPYQLLWTIGQFNIMVLAAAAGIRIMQLFLRLRNGWSGLYHAGNWLAAAAVAFVVLYACLAPWAARHQLPLLQILNGTREVLLLSLFGYGWLTLAVVGRVRAWRRVALYYALTFFFFSSGFAVFWFNHIGLTSFNPIYPNPLAWGLVLELLVLCALLTGRFRHTLRHNARLRVRQLRQRNALGTRLIAAQEEERTQLARELHDALGPNLAALHLAWQGPALQQALATSAAAATAGRQAELLLRHLRDEVRTYSHSLLPAQQGLASLVESITNLGELISLYGSPVVHTHCEADIDLLPPALQQAAYRIAAELLNNAVRHARATEIHVTLHRRPTELEIVVADNGRGFDTTTPSNGIGLRGVRARTDYLRGQLTLDSSADGTRVVVVLPC